MRAGAKVCWAAAVVIGVALISLKMVIEASLRRGRSAKAMLESLQQATALAQYRGRRRRC